MRLSWSLGLILRLSLVWRLRRQLRWLLGRVLSGSDLGLSSLPRIALWRNRYCDRWCSLAGVSLRRLCTWRKGVIHLLRCGGINARLNRRSAFPAKRIAIDEFRSAVFAKHGPSLFAEQQIACVILSCAPLALILYFEHELNSTSRVSFFSQAHRVRSILHKLQ